MQTTRHQGFVHTTDYIVTKLVPSNSIGFLKAK